MVFLSGTTMVIIFWAISPLQSAILGVDVVSVTKPVTLANTSQLIPMADQRQRMGPEILSTGYAIQWLGQSYPPFMASDYALLPFYVENDPALTKLNTNWTATTTRYTTELECWPAQVFDSGPPTRGEYNFLNGQGCNTTVVPRSYTEYSMHYIGYETSPWSDYWLGGPACPPTSNSTHQFLAIWWKQYNDYGEVPDYEMTALFCQPYYFKQEVRATVRADTLEPIASSIEELSDKKLLSGEEFNSTAFEFLLAHGIDENPVLRDRPFNNAIELNPQIEDTGLNMPVENMVGFAVAGNDRPTGDYSDPKVLQAAFADTHKYLFSVAVSTLLTNKTDALNVTATSTFSLTGIVASQPFCASVEALLVLAAAFTFLLLWLSHTSLCNLTANPSSISRLGDVFRNSPDLLSSFRKLDTASEKVLMQSFQGDQFRLIRSSGGNLGDMAIVKVNSGHPDSVTQNSRASGGHYDPVQPFVLNKGVGISFIAVLSGAVAGLAYMHWKIHIQTG